MKKDEILLEAAKIIERYRDQLLYHSDCRPKSKEVQELLARIYAEIGGK